jgi:hypothetical protein
VASLVSSRRIVAACAAIAAIGLARIVHVQRRIDLRAPVSRRELEAFRAVAQLLPPDARRVGYVSSDEEPNPFADVRYVQATYELAPRAVVRDARGVIHVVATFDDDAAFAGLCARHGLVPVAVVDRGVALTRRVAP